MMNHVEFLVVDWKAAKIVQLCKDEDRNRFACLWRKHLALDTAA